MWSALFTDVMVQEHSRVSSQHSCEEKMHLAASCRKHALAFTLPGLQLMGETWQMEGNWPRLCILETIKKNNSIMSLDFTVINLEGVFHARMYSLIQN